MRLGVDIGGANLKASDGVSQSRSLSFPIWKHPDRLAETLREFLAHWGNWTGLAVTMTAELADCFASKSEGVGRILDAVDEVAAGRPVGVWQTGGEFLATEEARDLTRLVAAANWHALATWAGRMTAHGAGLLIDIGSTTTDIIPLVDGLPATTGATDLERLLSGELVYAGVRRTPLCALAESIELRGGPCPLAAELFATTRDLFLLTEETAEDPTDLDTADGRPATIPCAHARIAHLVCCDAAELSRQEASSIARQLRDRLVTRLSRAVTRIAERLPAACQNILLCGEGEFLARQAVGDRVSPRSAACISLTAALGPRHSSAACAFALARLAHERFD